MKHYGIGELTAVTILAELGDARRFSSSRHAVRYPSSTVTADGGGPVYYQNQVVGIVPRSTFGGSY